MRSDGFAAPQTTSSFSDALPKGRISEYYAAGADSPPKYHASSESSLRVSSPGGIDRGYMPQSAPAFEPAPASQPGQEEGSLFDWAVSFFGGEQEGPRGRHGDGFADERDRFDARRGSELRATPLFPTRSEEASGPNDGRFAASLRLMEERWPSEVISHLGLQQSSRPDERRRPREPVTSGLRLVGGACQIPKPEKVSYGGEDSYFICPDGSALGVADGVGEWERLGVCTRPLADMLMGGTSAAAEALSAAGGADLACNRASLALQRGWASVDKWGACTASVAALDRQGACLGVANLGDSGVRQVRKPINDSQGGSRVVNFTREQQHFFNCPYQLSNAPGPADFPSLLAQGKRELVEAMQGSAQVIKDGPGDAELYTFPLCEGDVLILGSDGLFDNLNDSEILEFIDLTVTPLEARQVFGERAGTLRGPSSSTDPGALATTIAHAAYHRACDPSAATPFAALARSHGVNHSGGKQDDITVVCAWVVRVGK